MLHPTNWLYLSKRKVQSDQETHDPGIQKTIILAKNENEIPATLAY